MILIKETIFIIISRYDDEKFNITRSDYEYKHFSKNIWLEDNNVLYKKVINNILKQWLQYQLRISIINF